MPLFCKSSKSIASVDDFEKPPPPNCNPWKFPSRAMTPISVEDPIPTYTIDLAQPPNLRYAQVAKDFGPTAKSMEVLFDDILEVMIPVAFARPIVKRAAKLFLRRLHDPEENEEIKGFSKFSGVDIWLIVALNTVLDCLLGCTSGSVPVREGKKDTPRLMHFRTLDWGMDDLRELLIVVEFVDSRDEDPTKVIARSVTYAGFVGTLTAVRENLSLSMNFRPNHTCSDLALMWHQLMVLLGQRRALGSLLRKVIFDKNKNDPEAEVPLQERAKRLASENCAPCYLILCDGKEAAVIEKDLVSGSLRTANEFIAQTNHDINQAETSDPHAVLAPQKEHQVTALGIEDWLEESTERYDCIVKKWEDQVARNKGSAQVTIHQKTLQKWMSAEPIMSSETHFGSILDPRTGQVCWIQRGPFRPENEFEASTSGGKNVNNSECCQE